MFSQYSLATQYGDSDLAITWVNVELRTSAFTRAIFVRKSQDELAKHIFPISLSSLPGANKFIKVYRS